MFYDSTKGGLNQCGELFTVIPCAPKDLNKCFIIYRTTTAKHYVVCRNTAQVLTLKIHVLQFLNVQIKSHNILSLLHDMKLLSRDKSLDFIEVLSCRATLFECLRQNHLSLRQVPMM